MADSKISALPVATTPLAGTEVLPIVQSGATKKATVANIVGAGTSAGSFTGVTSTAPIGIISQTSAGSSGYVQLSGTANYQVFGGSFIGGTVVEAAAGGVYVKVDGANITAATANGLEVLIGNLIVGTAGKGISFSANGGVIWRCGSGTPEGAVTAPVGSLFTRTDGGAGTTLYVKESGAGNTGWIAK